MIAESSKVFIFQKFAFKVYFRLSLHIFQRDLSLSLKNICESWCMHQTGFSSRRLCHKVNLPSCVARRPLCHKVNLPSCVARQPLCHKLNLPRCEVNLPSCVARRPLKQKVNLPRCEARRRIMTCDIFGTGQTNSLTLCYLLGKTYKLAHSNATLESLKSTRSTKLLEKLLT